jgi:phosphoglycerate dehydrogenase-like enzyme
MMRVAYTDPVWALDGGGEVDTSLADVESTIYGEDIAVDLGIREAGRWVVAGAGLNEYVAGADALVVYRAQVTPELLEATGPDCKVIARQGVGLDNLNIPLLKSAGLYGFHVPDYCGDEVSTHAIALLLALERSVCLQDRLVKGGEWGIHAGGVPRRTAERTVAIIGFGRIGRATSRKVGVFYDSVLAYDPYVPADLMASFGVRKVGGLDELLAAADAVLLHADLNAETESIIGSAALAGVRPGALLVNTARGKLVDPGAVLAALEAGRLGGFASDVFSPEDPNDDPVAARLLERGDVVVSSHRAFLSVESERSLRRRIAEGVAHVLRSGEPPELGRVA